MLDEHCSQEISKDFLMGFYNAISAFELQVKSGGKYMLGEYCDPEISKDFLIGFYDAIATFELQVGSGDNYDQALLTVMANGCSLDKNYDYRLGFSDAEMKLNDIGGHIR